MDESACVSASTFGERLSEVTKPHLEHLTSSSDIRTSYEAVRAGFVSLALERNRRATPFVAQARALKLAALAAHTPSDLLSLPDIRAALLTAAGISDKAEKHLQDADKKDAIVGLIRNFLEPAGANFVEELVFRFLLTRGDTLGGSMRNVGGFLAQCKLTRCLISHLQNAGNEVKLLHSATRHWVDLPNENAGIEHYTGGLHWNTSNGERVLIYNLTVPFVGKNVDLCLFDCNLNQLGRALYGNASAYIALGELKGGIDPAGADEHWKTARTALTRIREAFTRREAHPKEFFIGAAIVADMSNEIWSMLESGVLDNAANLTDDGQMDSISAWLCSL